MISAKKFLFADKKVKLLHTKDKRQRDLSQMESTDTIG